eukprot:7554436-Heterocapsa_arctica.AAC.1
MIDLIAAKRGWPTMIIDTENTYFHGEGDELVAVEPPDGWLEKWVEEGGDEDVVWELVRQLCERRKASKVFNQHVADLLSDIELAQC